MFSQNRTQIRQFFFDSWQKYLAKQLLTPLEKQLIAIIQQHPEYHFIFDNREKYQDQEFFAELGDTNPFLHIGLHMSLTEQISTNRPAKINTIYQQLIKKLGDHHKAEHQMMNCLVMMLDQCQQTGQQPDEKNYVEQLEKLF